MQFAYAKKSLLAGLLLLSMLFFFALAENTRAADCGAGFHPAAANEIPGVAAGTCTPDGSSVTNITNGGCDFNPYQYLEQFKAGNNILITPNGSGNNLQDGINPTLACRMAKVLQKLPAGCIKISSAYRSEQTQANTCASICGNPGGCSGAVKCGAPGASCHQYGLALDLDGPCLGQLQQMLGVGSPTAQGQQDGLFFPMPGDKVHIQCIEDRVGYCSPSSPKCDGNVNVSSSQGPYTPTSGLANQIRQALGMPQQAPPPPPQPPQQQQSQATPQSSNTNPSSTGGNPTACTPSYSCTGGTYYYQTSSCTTIPLQKCPAGCDSSGTSCAASSTSSTGVGSAFATSTGGGSDNTNTNTNSNGTSTYDLIDQYANPVSSSISTEIGTATQIGLNGGLNEAVVAYGQPPSGTTGQYSASNSAALSPSIGGQQSFTSDDLANTSGSTATGDNSFLIRLWTTIRDSLLYILQQLRPFRHGGEQIQQGAAGIE